MKFNGIVNVYKICMKHFQSILYLNKHSDDTDHLHLVPRSNNECSCNSTPQIRLNGVVLS
jgi:hypothetical protein